MRIATALFLSSALILCGCKSSKKNIDDLDADISGTGCLVDQSKGADTALPLPVGVKAVGMICPRADQDFYIVQVAEGMNLLDVNIGYPSVRSTVALQARLYEADGVTQVLNATASDTNVSDKEEAVKTTFAVPKAGSYVLRVSDTNDANSDSVNSYVLQVAGAADPDTHESNDTVALAKAADGLPGFFSSLGDVDIYQVTIANAGSLLQMKVTNPLAAKSPIEYEIMDSTSKVIGTGTVQVSATPSDLTQAAPATGILYVFFHYPVGTAPDRRVEAGYTVVLGEIAETDSNEKPIRNDMPTTATCLAGASTPCAAVFSGTAVTYKTQSGTIGSRGDRDYYMFRATSAPAVVEAILRVPATTMDLALDILIANPGNPCTVDAECKVLGGACTENDDCELSHECIAAQAGACTSTTCRQCAGSGLCLPLPDNPGKSACGVTLYSAVDLDGGATTGPDGTNLLRTAQPVFAAVPVYVVVHDNKDNQYDPAATYTLNVQVAPEPDPGDNSLDAKARNNYYTPRLDQETKLDRNKARAKDITAEITAGTSIAGYISYQADMDWFSFSHPCPGVDCGLIFEWVQPGPSSVRPVFLLRTESLGLHESWVYTGPMPTTAPITDLFGDGDCTECSFASAKHTASGSTPYKYYIQVRDAGADDWDFTPNGRYEFRLKTVTTGCPASCSEHGTGVCECFCKAKNLCPAGPAL
jgi:hypothetical protein